MKKRIIFLSVVMILIMMLTACSSLGDVVPGQVTDLLGDVAAAAAPEAQAAQPEVEAVQPIVVDNGLLAAYENSLTEIYDGVNPSVVSIRVVSKLDASQLQSNLLPGIPNNQQDIPQYSQGQGSGFVWDLDGHIITNNHVIAGADKIEVTFFDGTIVTAELVGADVYSDLAVIKVDVSKDFLQPVQMADSDLLKVGQLAIAIGNPFGLENTMTIGIISALGRTIPAGQESPFGLNYSIPDIIQTDAPINPGNSGGVLVDEKGMVTGVTAAIELPVRANAGIGFAIPANIVSRVVPVLIKEGKFEHPYLGISGTALTPDLAEAMDLAPEQRGVLVVEVTADGPADSGGLRGSDRQVTIDGQDLRVGGDVITLFDGEPILDMDDLIAYLSSHTEVGQKITLTVLREGKAVDLEVTLRARPSQQEETKLSPIGRGATLGIIGLTMNADLATAMDLTEDQTGVLVQQVESGSAADKAGLHGSYKPVMIKDQRVLVGGDIITAFDRQPVNTIQELAAFVGGSEPDQEVELTLLRDGKVLKVIATLGERPIE